MKRKISVLVVLILILNLLSAFSVPDGGITLADGLSESAAVQLFTAYGNTGIFAYTDGETHILKTDGSAACTTAYPASRVFLRGQSITAFSARKDFLTVERFDANSLTRTDLFGIDLPESDLLDLDTDSLGHTYAVRLSEPDTLYIFDEAGSYVGTLSCPANILGIQVMNGRLYLFLPEQCLLVTWEQDIPHTYTKHFTYPSSAVPFCILSDTAYIGTNGIVYLTDGTALTFTGQYALRDALLASDSEALFWAGSDITVFRYSFSSANADYCSLPGTPAALTGSAAVVRTDDQYRLISFGNFQPLVPAATPSSPPSALPTAAPSSSSSPPPSASSSPTPSPIPGVFEKNGYMYVPAGTTAAALRSSFPYSEVELCTSAMTAASGKIRTGWSIITPDTQYTLIVPGDVNFTGTVNSVDIRLLQQHLIGAQALEEIQLLAGDLNANNTPDAADLVLLAGLIQ